jgi:hypothetical protein
MVKSVNGFVFAWNMIIKVVQRHSNVDKVLRVMHARTQARTLYLETHQRTSLLIP